MMFGTKSLMQYMYYTFATFTLMIGTKFNLPVFLQGRLILMSTIYNDSILTIHLVSPT